MNTFGKLIKARTISFIEVLIKNYVEIGLNERQTLLIGKIYYMYIDNVKLDENTLAKQMGLDSNVIASEIVELVNQGYISIELKDGKEEYNLDGTIEKLGKVLEGEKATPALNRSDEMHKITEYAEKSFGRILSASELSVINLWLDEGYNLDKVKNAIDLSLRATRPSLKYADAIIVSEKERNANNQVVDEELKAVLNEINVKTK